MDIHNRLVADILTRYRALMMLATVQAEGERSNANPEAMAVTGISMKMEFDGMYSSVKEFLTLSRRIKELWIFGPLGREDSGRRTKENLLEHNVALVSDLMNQVEAIKMGDLAGRNGGTWEPLAREDEGASVSGPLTGPPTGGPPTGPPTGPGSAGPRT
ncbi:hypothetical protein ESCO_000092 [Escovopsis weberi]|uniref:Uncharacterized protein n=1 Tax=Escovopsis weberi TaxID=150374 RepID=A0A0M9VTN6_ESCWE|nr:hypothetical protein ESCO_000092 [Escovopsis weberi]